MEQSVHGLTIHKFCNHRPDHVNCCHLFSIQSLVTSHNMKGCFFRVISWHFNWQNRWNTESEKKEKGKKERIITSHVKEGGELTVVGSESNRTNSCKCHTYFVSFHKKLIAKLLKGFAGHVQCFHLTRVFSHPFQNSYNVTVQSL